MVRLTGFVTVGGRREPLNWTITPTGIVEGVGLSAAEIVIHSDAPSATPSVDVPQAVENTEPTSYDDLNKTELQVLCSQRELPTSGTKAEIIARLTESDGEGASETGDAEAEPVIEEGANDGGESDSK